MGRIAAAKTSSPAQKNSWRRGCQLDMVRVRAAAPIGAEVGGVVCRQAMPAGRVRRQRMGATGPDQEHRDLGESGRSVSVRDSGAGRPALAPLGDTADPGVPAARGLYDPALDKDSCGVGFIADIKGRKSHQIVEDALTILRQPRAPRRGRCRSARRRRRRHPGADPASILRQEGGGARLCPAGSGRVRDRRAVHAARGGLAARDSRRSSPKRSPTRAWSCSAGATCRPTIRRSANR